MSMAAENVGVEVSNEEYHSMPGVSNSRLKDYMEDPRVYWYRHLSGQYRQPSKAHFDFGQAVHDICLLGSNANIAVIPKEVLASNGAKSTKAYKEWAVEHAGKQQLKAEEFAAVTRCVEAVYSNSVASRLLNSPGPCERLFKTYDENLELWLRSKIDKLALLDSGNIVVDLKTTATGTTASKFVKHIANFSYHHQAYFYRKVLERCGIAVRSFVFIAVSVDEPHTADCYSLDDEFLKMAEQDVENSLLSLAERTRENNWVESNCNSIVELSPPNWMKYKGEYAI